MRWLQDRRRPGNPVLGFGLLALLSFIFLVPLFRCPCEGRLRTVPLAPPTEDEFHFTRAACRRCEGSGRIPLYDHWRVRLESK
jgi:hypothetical protein